MSDEFYHYGVPGMKWGVRKVRKAVDTVKKQHANNKKERRDSIDRVLNMKFKDLSKETIKLGSRLAAGAVIGVAAAKASNYLSSIYY